jgi:hypothetical protein
MSNRPAFVCDRPGIGELARFSAHSIPVELHPDIRIQALTIGVERAPLLVIDNLVGDPDELVEVAAEQKFSEQSRYYPGIRANAPPGYQELIAGRLAPVLATHFRLPAGTAHFSLCQYSLVTTPAERLQVPQRIPHVDSLPGSGLASIHYLFKRDLGGTAFYRHRKTGFEYIDEARNETYLASLRAENLRPDTGPVGYINGDTELYEQVARQEGCFNRMLIYRRNSLHSGCIAREFVPDPNPATGRLSINSFIDFRP